MNPTHPSIWASRILAFGLILLTSWPALSWGRIGIEHQSPLGNPDEAITDAASRTKYLLQRDQFHLSYNDDTHQANWVSWNITSDGLGTVSRTDAWAVEELLPAGYLRIGTASFGTHFDISWDRGHMAPSGDRTQSFDDNRATFRMSNIIPQAAKNNQGVWANFETYCRTLAANNHEVLIISGPSEFTPNRIPNNMQVPSSIWKIAVVVPGADSGLPVTQRIGLDTRVIAIITPNVSEGLGSWQSYITSVEDIEEMTGFNFFTEINPNTAIYLKNLVDTGTGPNNPTVITTFEPPFGPPTSQVEIYGFNFTAGATVTFGGVTATAVSVDSATKITATVPGGAETGEITVTTADGGTDTSYEEFIVTSGTEPYYFIQAANLTAFSTIEGTASASQVYSFSAENLPGPVLITAPLHFEVSRNGADFAATQTLEPVAGSLSSVAVYVRLAATAPMGTFTGHISHAGGGVDEETLAVSGTVLTSSPFVALSTATLGGFASIAGTFGPSKSYLLSGANLTGHVLVEAPDGFEVSLDNVTFAPSRTIAPGNGTLSNVPVYARINSSAAAGVVSGQITHTSDGATAESLAVSGTVGGGAGTPSVLAAWEVNGLSAYGPSPFAPTTSDPNVTVGGLTRGSGVTTTGNAAGNAWGGNGFDGEGGTAEAVARGDFATFTVASGGGATLSLTQIPAYNIRRSGTGPTTGQWQYQVGQGQFINLTPVITWGGTTTAGGNSQAAIDLSAIADLQDVPPGTTVTFRIVAYDAGANTGTFYINNITGNDLAIIGSLGTPPPPPSPAITNPGSASATAFASFSYQITADNDPTTFAAAGLPAGLSIDTATGLISGTPTVPGEYVIALTASNENGDGTAALTLTVVANPNAPVIQSDLEVPAQVGVNLTYQIVASNNPTTYLATNLPAGLTINTATGLISGTPTTSGTQQVTLTVKNEFGSDTATLTIGIRNPVLEIAPTSLNPFTATLGESSASQSYQLSGSDLTESITVTAPPNFEISLDNTNFTDGFNLSPAGGSLSFLLHVRLRSTAPLGASSGSIIHSGSGAVPQYLPVSGEAISTTPTLGVTPSSLEGFTTTPDTPSVAETYTLSGVNLTDDILVTAPNGYEISADEEDFGPDLLIVPEEGVIAALDLYVRLSADAPAGLYNGVITHSGGGAPAVTVALSGAVEGSAGPIITSTLSGSVYLNANFSYTINVDDDSTITGYAVEDLPPGLSLNTSTGVISGTPSQAGTSDITISATNAQGTTSATYRLVVMTNAEQDAIPVNVVVNKYLNAVPDRIELLVLGNPTGARPVDLRGMIIKDFNTNMNGDGGGKFIFNDLPLWSSVKAGTLIVLSGGTSQAEDFDASDFVIFVNLGNPEYFTTAATNFDIGNTDMVMIKAAGTGVDGVAGGIHALCSGTIGPFFRDFRGSKTNSRSALTGGQPFNRVLNNNGQESDFALVNGAARIGGLVLGSPHNAGNEQLIERLRGYDQDPPVITVLGDNPLAVALDSPFVDPGASAVDAVDGTVDVVVTSDVDTAATGTYTVTYRATDTSDNTAVATRTVFVVGAATPPSLVTLPAQSVTVTGAALLGEVEDEGSSPTTTRGFVYSQTETNPVLGGEGVINVTSGFGTGEFAATLSGLSASTIYYFRAYATNGDLSGYGEVLSFTTLKAEPTNHVTSFTPQSITTSNITASWTPAAGADGYLLVVSSSVVTPPVNGIPVANDTDVSDGLAAVNLGPATDFFDGFSGFAPGQIYSFAIFPYNNSGSDINYRTTSAPSFTAGLLGQPVLSTTGLASPLTTTYGTPSAASTFTISGNSLQGDVTVTASGNFEVSTDDQSFSSSVILVAVDGILTSTTVYVRLPATAAAAANYNTFAAATITSPEAPPLSVFTSTSGNAVSPQPLTVTGLTAASKVYDGTTDAEVAGTPVYEGLVNGESFEVGGTVIWAFADKNVGAGKALVRTGDFTAPSANYTMEAQPSLTTDVTAKSLGTTGATVTTKTYDTTTSASITGATLVGVIAGDTVTVSGGGTFNSANAGENKPVIANLTLGGTDAANYTLLQPALTGTITKAEQTITFAELPAKSANDPAFQLTATSSSGLAVTYTSSNEAIATISGGTVTLLAVGETTITASQPGNTNYHAATPVEQVLVVNDTTSFTLSLTSINNGTSIDTKTYTPVFNPASPEFAVSPTSFVESGGLTHVATDNAAYANWSGWQEQTRYFHYSVTAAAGHALVITAINSNLRSSNTGPRQIFIETATSLEGPWTKVAESNLTNTNNTAVDATELAIEVEEGQTLYIRYRNNSSVSVNAGTVSSSGTMRLNSGSIVGTYTMLTEPDTTAPVITILGDNPLTLAAGTTFTDPGATAEDETDGAVSVTPDGEVDTSTPGTYTVTYTAQDAAGNTAEATRTVIVVDLTPPVITLLGANPLRLALGESYTDPGATALDTIDGETAVQVDSSAVNTSVRGTYTVTYTATDAAGNTATATRQVQIGPSDAAHVLESEYELTGDDAAFTADPDGDGVPNLMEYAFGSDPTAWDSTPAEPELLVTPTMVRFTAVVRSNDPSLRVTPLISSNLQGAWSAHGVVELEPAGQSGVPQGFLRRTWEITVPDPALQFILFEVSYE